MPPPQSFYVQLRSALREDQLRLILLNAGPVRASGCGTAEDPKSCWFELETPPDESPRAVYERVSVAVRCSGAVIQRFLVMPSGMGPTLAAQFDLFGRTLAAGGSSCC